MTWPLSGSEAGVDSVLMQSSVLFICKHKLVDIRKTSFLYEKQLSLNGQIIRHVTVNYCQYAIEGGF